MFNVEGFGVFRGGRQVADRNGLVARSPRTNRGILTRKVPSPEGLGCYFQRRCYEALRMNPKLKVFAKHVEC